MYSDKTSAGLERVMLVSQRSQVSPVGNAGFFSVPSMKIRRVLIKCCLLQST